MEQRSSPRVSVVVATFNRQQMLLRLLGQLAAQTLAPDQFEVVVVDDGSRQPVRPALEALTLPYPLVIEAQANAGAAAARHRGVLKARGELVVVIDDDMQVVPEFLAEHLAAHPAGSRRCVLGAIRASPDLAQMPLCERWHQGKLDELAERCLAGARPRGNDVYTGNVSFRRADYLAVGGFDVTLGNSEDAELGLRLEAAGVELGFSARAATTNASDHTSLTRWRKRIERYGVFDSRIAAKHPTIRHASPWRFWPELRPVSRPLLLGSAMVPPVSRALSTLVYGTAVLVSRLGLERVALAGTTLAYGIDYYRGVRLEAGSAAAFLAARDAYLAAGPALRPEPPGRAGPGDTEAR
jgi:glycosyltransferase involved in cell wall biosynthesis